MTQIRIPVVFAAIATAVAAQESTPLDLKPQTVERDGRP